MISGAAKDSEPHRVVRFGDEGEMKRDRPKSVNLMRGREGGGRAARICSVDAVEERDSIGLVARRMSEYQP